MMILVQALVTALMAGVVSGVVLFGLNERRERQRLLMEKAEAAVDAYATWTETLQKFVVSHIGMFGADRPSGREKITALWGEATVQFARAHTLIGIYLPERLDALDRVSEANSQFMAHRAAMIEASFEAGPIPEEIKTLIGDAHRDVVAASREGRLSLIIAAGNHARGPFLVRGPTIRLPRFRRQRRD